jgi:zinc protease
MMLGNGQSSHLYRELRENRELVYEVGAFTWNNPTSEGLLGVAAECDPEKRDEVVAAVLEQISQYQNQDFTLDLSRAKRQTMVTQWRTLTSASGRASDLASNWHEARDLHFTSRFLEAVENVTADDIRRCCAALVERNLTITLLNPEEIDRDKTPDIESEKSTEASIVTLQNGLEIALFPDKRLPLISIQTAIRGGLSTVAAELAGIAPLLTATLDEGTETRSSWDIASTLEGLGASLGASAGNNTLIVSAGGLAEDRVTLIEILSDVLLHPSFPEDSLKRNQQSQLNSLLESLEDPLSVCMQQLRGLLFGENTYGLPSQGTEESLPRLTRDDLLAYHRAHFTAQNSKMAIAGDFDADELTALLEKHFSAMPSGESLAPAPTLLQHNLIKRENRNKKQAVLAIGYPGLSAVDERRFASLMLMEYCSDMAGPLFTRIREELGLAYQVGAFEFHGHDTGMMAFYLSTSPEQLDLAHRELQQQIRNIADQGIPEENFENVRATVLSALVLRQQSPGSIARQAAVDLLFGQQATHHREVHRKIEGLLPHDIRELAKSILRDELAVTSIVQP